MQEAITETAKAKGPSSVETTRVINTHQFGSVTVSQHHIFEFADGLFGFENLREFVLISVEESKPLKWLLSVEEPTIGFPVISPLLLDVHYTPGRKHMRDGNVLFVVVNLRGSSEGMTANMKAPIILNPIDQSGQQVILTSEKYSPEFEIGSNARKK